MEAGGPNELSHARERLGVVYGPVRPALAKLSAFTTTLVLLGTALGARTPVFRSVPEMAAGTLFWTEEQLPNVFVAQDVFARLQAAWKFPRARRPRPGVLEAD